MPTPEHHQRGLKMMLIRRVVPLLLAVAALGAPAVHAQRGGGAAPPQTPRMKDVGGSPHPFFAQRNLVGGVPPSRRSV